LRTRAIPEHLRGMFTTRRYTNPCLPLPLPLLVYLLSLLVMNDYRHRQRLICVVTACRGNVQMPLIVGCAVSQSHSGCRRPPSYMHWPDAIVSLPCRSPTVQLVAAMQLPADIERFISERMHAHSAV